MLGALARTYHWAPETILDFDLADVVFWMRAAMPKKEG